MQACTWKEQRMAPSWYKSDEISSRDKAQKILFDADGAYTLQWDEFPLTYTIIPKTQQLSEKHWGVWGVSGGKLTQQHGDQELQLKTHGRGWAELCLPSLKKEGRLRPAVVNYLFLVTRNAERTLFAWRKTIISYKKKKNHNEKVQHWKSCSARLCNLCPWRFSEWRWKKPSSDLEIICCEKEHGLYNLRGPFKPKLFFYSNYWLQTSLLLHLLELFFPL